MDKSGTGHTRQTNHSVECRTVDLPECINNVGASWKYMRERFLLLNGPPVRLKKGMPDDVATAFTAWLPGVIESGIHETLKARNVAKILIGCGTSNKTATGK